MTMDQINVCITGSDGFIGSHLLDQIKQYPQYNPVIFAGDLLKKEDVDSFFAKHKIDQTIFLVGSFFGDINSLIDLNVTTLANYLEAATKIAGHKIIYTSTGAVYGEPLHALSVESDPILPNTEYGFCKKTSEELIQYYHRMTGMDFVILRFPNVFGPHNAKGVVYSFLKDIQERGSITIFGDGNQSRNFLHVDDACEAIVKSLDYAGSDVFNISNSKKTTLNDLVDIFKQEFQFTVEYQPQNNNLRDLLLNTDKAKVKLGFEANRTINVKELQ